MQFYLGNKAAEYFENGKLVPDDIMIPLVLERVARDDCQKRGWMLDGFPRTGPQAAALVSNGLSADVFVLIEVPDDVSVIINLSFDTVYLCSNAFLFPDAYLGHGRSGLLGSTLCVYNWEDSLRFQPTPHSA